MANPKYTIVGELGKGGFGVVYLIQSDSGPKLALKTVDLRKIPLDYRERAEEEAQILKKLNHPFLVHHVNSYMNRSYLCIITEFCAAGDLDKFTSSLGFVRGLPEKLITCWLMQTAAALNYMHTHSPVVLHRDLKPQNIYVTETADLRLGDLGLARKMTGPQDMANTVAGTILYLSPEMLSQQPYNSKTDIWSLGCVFYDITGKRGGDDMGGLLLLMQVMGGRRLPLPDQYSDALKNVITKMLTRDPRTRPSAANILASPVISDFNSNPERPADIIAKHARSIGKPTPKIAKDLRGLRGALSAPLTSDDIVVTREALKALDDMNRTTVAPQPATVTRKMQDLNLNPAQALDGMSSNSLFLFGNTRAGAGGGGGAGGGDGGAVGGASGGDTDTDDTFFDDKQIPEYEEEYFVLKIQQLQTECTQAFGGPEILEAAYGIIKNTKDFFALKKNLEELLGRSMYAQYGRKILELRLLEYGLHRKTVSMRKSPS